MDVILDTNFLLIPGEFGVDIFTQIEEIEPDCSFYVVKHTYDELDKIAKTGKGSEKAAVKLAKQLMEEKVGVLDDLESDYADDEILEHARKGKFIVATLDKAFKERLKSASIPVITLKQKKYLIRI